MFRRLHGIRPSDSSRPSQAAILAGVQADYNAAFWREVSIRNLETAAGATSPVSTTAILGNVNDTFSAVHQPG